MRDVTSANTLIDPAPAAASTRAAMAPAPARRTVALAVLLALPPLCALMPMGLQNLSRVTLALCAVPLVWLICGGRARVERPDPLLGVAAPVFVAVFLLVALALPGGAAWSALWGAPGRLNGPLTYGAAACLFAALWRRGSPTFCRALLHAWTWVATGVAVHALLALAGVDALVTVDAQLYGQVVSGMLGNPNFAAVYFAMSVPIAVWAAAQQPTGAVWPRAAVLVLLCAALLTQTVQAPITLAAGALPCVAHRLLRGPWGTRTRLAVAAGATALVSALVVAGLLGAGPLARLRPLANVDSRLVDWIAAWRMFRSAPLLGIGPGQFMWHYGAVRPPTEVGEFGWRLYSDQAHSVPLDLLASGGVVLLGAYALVVFAIARLLWRGLRTLRGPRLGMLLAAGGAWTAYQVNSVIGIDEPTLLVMQWTAAGVVVALAAGGSGLVDVGPLTARRRGRLARLGWRAPWALVAAVALALPLTAELIDVADGPAAAVLEGARRAGPFWPDHLRSRGEELAEAGEYERALVSFRAALERRPRDHNVVLHAARAAAELADWQGAIRWYERFMSLEPHAADVMIEYATMLVDTGTDHDRARRLVATVLRAPYASADERRHAADLCEWIGACA